MTAKILTDTGMLVAAAGCDSMNARQLEVFRAIMRQGSLTAAAELLHVSQPAVSKVLRHFETKIGYGLFEHVGGRLAPTAEAHLLFREPVIGLFFVRL